MASQSPQHEQLLQHGTEVSCDSSGDGAVSVRINNSHKPLKHLQPQPQPHGSEAPGCGGRAKPCKYSISSSCSSAESGLPRTAAAGLCGRRRVPQLFERSAGLWWNPRFDSSILEKECRERFFPQTRRRFRYVLFYLATAAVLWGVYFAVNGARCDPVTFLVPTAAFLLACLLLFLFTFTRLYGRFYTQASLLLIVVTFAITLAPQAQKPVLPHPKLDLNVSPEGAFDWVPCISPVGTFSLCMEVLLLLYSVLHVRLYAAVLLGVLYSLLFEVLGWLFLPLASRGSSSSERPEDLAWLLPAKALLHLCAHAIGVQLFVMSEARSRTTFLKVGQAIMHGKDLEVEKALKERMIHSVMPRRVADELMKQGDEEGEASGKRYSSSSTRGGASSASGAGGAGASASSSPKGHKRKKTSIPRAQIIFRPFNMKRMEPVSILFADIVGFTKMSANKSAHALVGLLNDLFGRFDQLCELTRCEKISTLGDCYYCVAGCPEPRPDHAYCCVEMGLGMIQAIEQFCQEKREMVDMRVGVHTGTVLCGILGMKRFKFDVWSNDVNLANLMEQLGVAGKVHLSQATAAFLDDRYQREDGQVTERVGRSVVAEQLKGMKTYLISGRKLDKSQCSCSQLGLAGHGQGDALSPASHSHTPDVTGRDSVPQAHTGHTPPAAEEARYTLADQAKSSCPSCSVLVQVEGQTLEEGAVQNGCQDEHKTNSSKVRSHAPKALNGLLSLPEEPVSSSQTSLCEMLQETQKKWAGPGAMDHSALIPLRSKSFRERSNAHFVEVIKEDSLMKDYFFRPPINKLSLNFLERSLESAYRTSYQEEMYSRAPVQTFATPRFSSFLDMLLSCAVFLALTLACFLRPWMSGDTPPTPALAFAIGAALLEGVALVLSIRMAFYLDSVLNCTQRLLRAISGWVPRHVIGAVLVSLPAVSVFTHFPCDSHLSVQFTMFICCAVIIAIIQYSNFCQLSSWMRSVLATVAGVALLVLLYSPLCRPRSSDFTGNISDPGSTPEPDAGSEAGLQAQLRPEAILAFFLVLLLLWFLNRELEVSYRLHYHGNVEADKHRIKIQNMRDQANWLLGNLIPMHVAEQLKVTQSYSKNHDDAGVIFASIVNFSEFYEESYEGGKECYRVLNELIGDFDELLRRPAFQNIEKIKTIGATYMAASGLNAQQCAGDPARPHGHLRALFDFALEMMRVMDDFNKNMLGFQFKLRIGFNHGPLTAGVIGTTKLLYDIWGDTVNIASRMDSTGVECRVQVSEESHRALSEMGYRFDYRGTVNVKGKGQMRTFLYPKSADSGPAPCLRLPAAPTEEASDKVRAGSSPGTVPSRSPTPTPIPTPAPVSGDRGATPNTAEDPEPVSVPSLPNNVTPLSNLALPHNPAPSSSAKQTTSTASVSPLLADLAQPEPPGSAPREEEAEEEEEGEEEAEEEGEEEANELTRLRGAERL
ncbi:adenylate cyclase type 9-like isoform X2 [Anguilla anguilla]|uniref:adenylate cyclase type 9-like isoform X2 n=1 Tax=Anguilla anguilla TaxID=7936 RepID=UPI0015A76968|nr:adenylate cyclase type 9-like isoform X2 [Anguilla anguilla]